MPVTPQTVEQLATIATGHQIGPYLVQGPLGRGSTAVVYRAVHAFLEREVALKVMPPEDDPLVTDRFLDEARLLSKLSHPGLVKIYDCGVLPEGGAFLAMELLEGELLHDRMHRLGRMPLPDMVEIIRQLADALEVVHDAGLVHRDVKPSNIFLVENGVKLLDFGVAKQLDARPRTLPGMLLGTPYYMSPEQCRGVTHIDRRTDVYAMGAVLFQMATGRPPFDKASLPEVIEAHLLHTPPPLSALAPELPPLVGEVVARALAKAPDDRFSCALAMANALADAKAQGPRTAPMKVTPAFDPGKTIPHKAVAAVLLRPTRPMARTQAQPRRQMLLAALVAAAVTGALIFVVAKLAAPPPPTVMETPAAPAIAPSPARNADPPAETPLEPPRPQHHHRPSEIRPPELQPPPEPERPPAAPFKKHPTLLNPFDDPDVAPTSTPHN